ncbi:hypothetical protein [Psychroserpens sp. NJDZ02]|uniref:hypothetical protein n=1 Tax=Psychroserpens sp. NJDZ02 TaxID=2570561 RepID=UPI0010A81E9F|nr:hypothetical protein [Psychroserpens sp. NJDZ02]QCE43273.1 hypothetical protein E9099_18230 [Psychroserpens sp. NJDZ02]
MKGLFKFLIVISSLSVHSQRLCELGEYDFITNTIIGIDKGSFSKIEYVNNNEPLNERVRYINYYDDFGRLINADYKGNGHFYGGENIETGCYEVENVTYQYSDTIIPKEIKVENTREKYNYMLYYNKYNKITKIEYTDAKGVIGSIFNLEYNEKNQLTVVNKGAIKYYYEWDNSSRIKKITIPDLFYTIYEYSFDYVNNRIATIKFTARSKDNKDDIILRSTYSYTYKNDKLDKIMYSNITYGKSDMTIYNYDNEDKLIITDYDSKGVYESHYECYY